MFDQLSLRDGHRLPSFGDASREVHFELPRYIVWQRLAAAARVIAAALAERRRLRRCEQEFRNLDDRTLKDIGITRQSGGSVLRYGRVL
jgi:uncharacterized protein YjiS (DUF1127 family)